MRMLFSTLVAAFVLCTTASFALEQAAGTDTVNASQIGLNAKIDAGNKALLSVINQILACNRSNQLYDSSTNTCAPARASATDVTAILNCGANNQFYNSATKACGTTRATDSDVTAILNCNHNKQFYDSATKTCVSAASTKLTISSAETAEAEGTPKYTNWITADYCALDYVKLNLQGHSSNCSIERSGSKWRAVATGKDSSNRATCGIICYTQQ
jgi:hypothetical protein